jgi:hypothetical protein
MQVKRGVTRAIPGFPRRSLREAVAKAFLESVNPARLACR